jgi:hypothetical protein
VKERTYFVYKIFILYFVEFFSMPLNVMTWGLKLYFASEGRHVAGCYGP